MTAINKAANFLITTHVDDLTANYMFNPLSIFYIVERHNKKLQGVKIAMLDI